MYSTCSIAPEENERVVQWALDNVKGISLEQPWEDIGVPGYLTYGKYEFSDEMLKVRRLFTHIHDTPGFFYALFRKDA
jgi:16S rRNA C967 or C1407 C5-methylase (RsmB/RsmF family)